MRQQGKPAACWAVPTEHSQELEGSNDCPFLRHRDNLRGEVQQEDRASKTRLFTLLHGRRIDAEIEMVQPRHKENIVHSENKKYHNRDPET